MIEGDAFSQRELHTLQSIVSSTLLDMALWLKIPHQPHPETWGRKQNTPDTKKKKHILTFFFVDIFEISW